jgi:hypothetical protein
LRGLRAIGPDGGGPGNVAALLRRWGMAADTFGVLHRPVDRPGYVVSRENRMSISVGTRTQQNTSIRSGSSGTGASANTQGSAGTSQNALGASRQNNAAGMAQRGEAAANPSGASANQQATGSAAAR